MPSSAFTKSVNFESISKIPRKKNYKSSFLFKNNFYECNFFYKVYFNRPELDLSDEPIKISISVENYDEKTAAKYRNCCGAKKRIVSKL